MLVRWGRSPAKLYSPMTVAARTDRTSLCVPCALRTSPGVPCPRCGEIGLMDLRKEGGRAPPAALGQPRRAAALERGLGRALTATTWSGLCSILLVSLLGAPGLGVLAAGVLVIVHLVLLFILFFAYGLLKHARLSERDPQPSIMLADEASSPKPMTTVEGRVHLVGPITSLLGHRPCGAYRLFGEGPMGPIDDGAGGRFEVHGPHGIARVDASRATLDLPIAKPALTIRLDAALRRFLDARGVYTSLGPVRLSEATLQEGDMVEVSGVAHPRTEAGALRTHQRVLEFSEANGPRLTVKRLSP